VTVREINGQSSTTDAFNTLGGSFGTTGIQQ
jgi:hypothetical protein